MKKSRFSEQQIAVILRQAEEGTTVDLVCRKAGISQATYKRQMLNALRIIVLYNRLRANPHLDIAPRTFLFAGKTAPA